jgi:two-component system, cell cycle response regulator
VADRSKKRTLEDFRDTTEAVGFVPIDYKDQIRLIPTIIVIGGKAFGQSYTLDHDITNIGRGPKCNIHVDDDGVSREHAQVIRVDEEWVLVDLNSTNGTYHDGESVQVRTLRDGDKFQLGSGTILRFQFQDVVDERYQKSMYESKTRDALTGIFNRGYFMEAIEREIAFTGRHGQTLALVLFDIDHFKHVNDTYGHSVGDVVLKRLCLAVEEIIRKEDVFARYGGEEFALLLRNTSSEMAFILAERMRRCIERLEIIHDGFRVPITISIGIACTSEDIGEVQPLISIADERLYRAKNGGRNRTEAVVVD